MSDEKTAEVISHAKQINKYIEEKYQYNGKYYAPQANDIMDHLKSDNVDHNDPAPFKNFGFDESFDGSLVVFYYADKSVLVVGSFGINAPM
jgi:hypothetical protein